MRKVLIITYYWPPAGGPGVQRWLKFVKYLRDFDIEPLVYIPKNPHYPLRDESFIKEVPQDIAIYDRPIFEPYGIAGIFSRNKTRRISSGIINAKDPSVLEKLFLWVRGNLFIPDARKFWVGPSITFLDRLIREEGIPTIITTGPPHSVHLIGKGLKDRNRITWIADFRDPWTSIGYHHKLRLMLWAQKKHKDLERMVLNAADKILVTSRTTQEEFSQLTKKPITVITNGYDGESVGSVELDPQFTVSHIGSLLTGRDPINLWQALFELIREHCDFEQRFRLQLAGTVGADVLASIREHGLGDHLELLGYLGHEDALACQRRSQVLLLIEIDSPETAGIIPGKVFEYMAAARPILGVGPRNWEVADLVADTHTGKVFLYQQAQEIKETLWQWFQQYQNRDLVLPDSNIGQYHRRELTRKLAQEIK